jgi:hypothetical protein
MFFLRSYTHPIVRNAELGRVGVCLLCNGAVIHSSPPKSFSTPKEPCHNAEDPSCLVGRLDLVALLRLRRACRVSTPREVSKKAASTERVNNIEKASKEHLRTKGTQASHYLQVWPTGGLAASLEQQVSPTGSIPTTLRQGQRASS